jgi:hypothetical protein
MPAGNECQISLADPLRSYVTLYTLFASNWNADLERIQSEVSKLEDKQSELTEQLDKLKQVCAFSSN